MRKKFSIGVRAAVSDNSSVLELHFLDLICDKAQFDWWSGDVVETNIVEEVINRVKDAKPTLIRCIIDSEGGDAFIGLAIYNFLKNYPAKVEAEIIGMCGSAATMPAMAASKGKLKMARNAFMVIHQAWGGGLGTSADLRQQADVIDRVTVQYVDVYAQRTGKTTEEISALIENGDYWMSGAEAQAAGFCDEVFNSNEQFSIAARIKTLDSSNYQNIPSNLTEEVKADTSVEQPAGIMQSLKQEFMDFKAKVSAFIDSLKGKEVKPDQPNVAAEVAAAMAEPMQTLAEGLQQEVSAEIKKAIDPLTEKVDELTKANEKLSKEKADLETELAEKLGSQSSTTTTNAEVKKPIGRFVKA